MKKMIVAMLAMATLWSFNSCELIDNEDDNGGTPFSSVFNDDLPYTPCEEDLDITADELPDAIFAYLESNYPGFEIDDLDQYLENGDQRFGLEIDYQDEEIELLFTAEGNLINAGEDGEEVTVDVDQLPQAAQDYLDMEFPNAAIEEVSLELDYGYEFFEVSLSNQVEVYFTADGTFACSEEDDEDDEGDDDEEGEDDDEGEDEDEGDDDNEGDDDDEGDDDEGDDDDEGVAVPQNVAEYIQANYPNYVIEYAELEDYCQGKILEVEIEMGGEDRDLYFEQNGTFLFEEISIAVEALPQEVMSSLQAEYPGFGITDAEQLDMADGSTRYWVEVEKDQSDQEFEIILEADGSIVCSFED